MKFKTRTVKGHGRGKGMGFPTINMIVPENIPLQLRQGVYAARATVKDETYDGALYYGPAPTFNQTSSALEIYLIDIVSFYVGENEPIEIEAVKFIRGVESFGLPELLIVQMEKDVEEIRKVLKS